MSIDLFVFSHFYPAIIPLSIHLSIHYSICLFLHSLSVGYFFVCPALYPFISLLVPLLTYYSVYFCVICFSFIYYAFQWHSHGNVDRSLFLEQLLCFICRYYAWTTTACECALYCILKRFRWNWISESLT